MLDNAESVEFERLLRINCGYDLEEDAEGIDECWGKLQGLGMPDFTAEDYMIWMEIAFGSGLIFI